MKLNNKTIWVIGASSNIGKNLVLEISKNKNVQMILSSRNKQDLVNIIKQTKLDDNDYLILPFDLQNQKKNPRLINTILDKFSKIDILINASNVSLKSPFMETEDELIRKIMDINYFSQVNICRKVIPIMMKEGGGTIVSVLDIFAHFSKSQLAGYSASKHALSGFYKGLNDEFNKDNIKTLILYGKKNINIDSKKILSEIKKQKRYIYLSYKDSILVGLFGLRELYNRLFNKLYKK